MSHAPSGTGLFIAFEGGEGSGKTTQIRRLVERLGGSGHLVVTTKEPGAGRIGAKIRALLLDPANTDLDPHAEALLYAADRAQHVATLVRPALDAGRIVITDRYMDSSVVYQGIARGLGLDEIRHLSMWGTRSLRPDLTILLDVDPEVGLRRATADEFGQADRLELEGLDFHRTVRAGFLRLAAADPDRYVAIDASQTADQISGEVWDAVTVQLPNFA